MNQLAQDCLEAIWKDAKPSQRRKPNWFEDQLQLARQVILENYIAYHACRFWAIHDTAQLQTEFDRRISDRGFNIGFSFDISDVDEEDEPWTAAWQMAISQFDREPPEMPDYTEAEVKEWLEEQFRPAQLTLALA